MRAILYILLFTLTASVLKWASGGGGGGGGRQNMQVPPQPINSHHATDAYPLDPSPTALHEYDWIRIPFAAHMESLIRRSESGDPQFWCTFPKSNSNLAYLSLGWWVGVETADACLRISLCNSYTVRLRNVGVQMLCRYSAIPPPL